MTTQGGVGGTSTGGIIHIACSSSLINSATNRLVSYGTDMSKVVFNVHNANTIWIRDYGPRFIYEGGARAIVDHRYNIFSRTADNAQPEDFAVEKKMRR